MDSKSVEYTLGNQPALFVPVFPCNYAKLIAGEYFLFGNVLRLATVCQEQLQ